MSKPSRQQIIEFAAAGDKMAEVFLTAWVNYCHLLDDLWDTDKSLSQKEVITHMVSFILQISGNEFYQKNRQRFESLIEQSHIAWMDSDDFAERDGNDRIAADVLKGFYHEVVFHAARIAGGWAHGLETARKYRDYDYEETD